MINVANLEVTFCGRVHERNWQGKPLSESTVKSVRKCVKECIFAKWWLNANCAHANFHEHNADEIFRSGLDFYSEREANRILAEWGFINQLNARIDQLHRFWNGGNLDKITRELDLIEESRYDWEDLSLAWIVRLLPEENSLKTLLLCAGTMSDKQEFIPEYWQLLEQAERILVDRKRFLLDWVKNKQPLSALSFTVLGV